MATLPTQESLGQRPTPTPSMAVASYQPTTGMENSQAEALQTGAANLRQASADFEKVKQAEIETQVNDDYVNKYIPFATQQSQQFYAKQGKDAVAAMPDFIASLSDQRNQMRDGMQGSYAKTLFDQKASRHVEMEMESAARYADQQQKVYDVQTHQAVLKSYADQAADKAGDPVAFQFALGSAQQEIMDFGTKHGQSADTIKQQFSDFKSDATKGMLQRLALTDPDGAMAMYQGTKDQPGLSTVIDAKDRTALEAHLTERAQNNEQSKLAQILLNGGDYQAKDGTKFHIVPNGDIQSMASNAMTVAKDYADKVHPNDARFEDQLLSRIRSEIRQTKYEKAMTDNDALGGVVAGMTDPETGQPRTFNDALNDPQWNSQYRALPLAQQGRIRSAFLQQENILTPESARMIDTIKGMAQTDPASFLNYDVGSLIGKVPQHNIQDIINLKASINKNAVKVEHMNTLLGDPSVVAALVTAGIPEAQIKAKSPNYNAFVGKFVPAVESWEAENKRKPQSSELAKIAGGLTATVTTDPGMVWDSHKKVYQLGAQDYVYPKTNDEIAALPTGTKYVVNGKKYERK